MIVAAGAGARMGAGVPKALMPLAGRPMVAWSIDAARAAASVSAVVVVGPPGRLDEMAAIAGPGVRVVPGGASRAESVREGLRAAGADHGLVVVHDAARPLAGTALFDAALDAVGDADGAIVATPVADTLKREDADGAIGGTLARAGLWAAQTPQAFRTASLVGAVEAAAAAGTLAGATDCAALVEAWGGTVRLVAPGGPNPKVTTPADVALAEALLGLRTPG